MSAYLKIINVSNIILSYTLEFNIHGPYLQLIVLQLNSLTVTCSEVEKSPPPPPHCDNSCMGAWVGYPICNTNTDISHSKIKIECIIKKTVIKISYDHSDLAGSNDKISTEYQ